MQKMNKFDIPEDRLISDDHLVHTCGWRQKGKCCKYIVWLTDRNNFYCGKTVDEAKKFLDEQASSAAGMIANSDNCKGIPCDENDQ